MALGKLNGIRLATRTREEMTVALPECWRALRSVGYRRRTLIVAFGRAWAKGDIRIDPALPAAPERVITPKS